MPHRTQPEPRFPTKLTLAQRKAVAACTSSWLPVTRPPSGPCPAARAGGLPAASSAGSPLARGGAGGCAVKSGPVKSGFICPILAGPHPRPGVSSSSSMTSSASKGVPQMPQHASSRKTSAHFSQT